MSETILAICIFALILMVQEVSRHHERNNWQSERKDLYDRLMSKDFREYKENTQPTPDYTPISKDDGDLYELEIEENKR